MTILNSFRLIDDAHYGDVRHFFSSIKAATENLEQAAKRIDQSDPPMEFGQDAQVEQPFFFTQKTGEILSDLDLAILTLDSFTPILSRAEDANTNTTIVESSG